MAKEDDELAALYAAALEGGAPGAAPPQAKQAPPAPAANAGPRHGLKALPAKKRQRVVPAGKRPGMNIPASDTTLDPRLGQPAPAPVAPAPVAPRPVSRQRLARPAPSQPEIPRPSVSAAPAAMAARGPSITHSAPAGPGASRPAPAPPPIPAPPPRTPPTPDALAPGASQAPSLPTSGARMEDIVARGNMVGFDEDPHATRRSQPLFDAKRPKPKKKWKPPWVLNLILGAIPGGRMIAKGEPARGVAFAAMGAVTLFPAAWVILGWSRTVARMRELLIDESLLIGHFVVALVSVGCFELLRLSAEMKKLDAHRRLPRILASLFFPSLVILIGTPRVLRYAPSGLEAAWFGALMLGFGSLLAAVWSAFHDLRSVAMDPKRGLLIGGGAVLALMAAGLMFAVTSSQSLRVLTMLCRDAGFQILPNVLTMFLPG